MLKDTKSLKKCGKKHNVKLSPLSQNGQGIFQTWKNDRNTFQSASARACWIFFVRRGQSTTIRLITLKTDIRCLSDILLVLNPFSHSLSVPVHFPVLPVLLTIRSYTNNHPGWQETNGSIFAWVDRGFILHSEDASVLLLSVKLNFTGMFYCTVSGKLSILLWLNLDLNYCQNLLI